MDSNFKLLVFWRFGWIDERLYYLPEELADAAIPVSFLQVQKKEVWFPDFTSLEGESIFVDQCHLESSSHSTHSPTSQGNSIFCVTLLG